MPTNEERRKVSLDLKSLAKSMKSWDRDELNDAAGLIESIDVILFDIGPNNTDAIVERLAELIEPEDDGSFYTDNLREIIKLASDSGGVEALKSRLMPKGYSWPSFEDGTPMEFGDNFLDGGMLPHTLHQVNVRDGEAAGSGASIILRGDTTSKYDGIDFNVWRENSVKRGPDRICSDVSTVKGKFTCSSCHQSWRNSDFANGRIAYCPSCGAQVMKR